MKIAVFLASVLCLALTGACGDDDGGNNNTSKDAGGNDTDAATAQLSCTSYCSKIETACSMADHQQYGSMVTCSAACGAMGANWPTGSAGAMNGNTLACRTYHAEAAGGSMSGARMTHCPHAGPSGGGACGSYCEVYCDAMEANCDQSFTDLATCKTMCQAANVATTGQGNATSGDNIQCRINHAILAGVTSGKNGTHCMHAALTATAPCI